MRRRRTRRTVLAFERHFRIVRSNQNSCWLSSFIWQEAHCIIAKRLPLPPALTLWLVGNFCKWGLRSSVTQELSWGNLHKKTWTSWIIWTKSASIAYSMPLEKLLEVGMLTYARSFNTQVYGRDIHTWERWSVFVIEIKDRAVPQSLVLHVQLQWIRKRR